MKMPPNRIVAIHELTILGVPIRVYTLNSGGRVIEKTGLELLLAAMKSGVMQAEDDQFRLFTSLIRGRDYKPSGGSLI